MGFGIDRRARSRKGRGLFRKPPDPREVADRLGRLVRRVLKGSVLRAGWSKDRYVVELALFDGAPRATLSVEPDGELVLRGETASLGPGYHVELAARIDPLLEELEYVWAETTQPVDLEAVRRAMCEWLAGELRGAPSPVRLGVPDSRQFVVDAPVLTSLGPRDAAWRDAVIADPLHARDAFPWWERGPGREALARALVAMWLEVPWREPLDQDERDLLERVHAELRAAWKAAPSMELPWAAWKELLFDLGIEDEDVSAKAGEARIAIGYRRHDLVVEISGGWEMTIPGKMVGNYEDGGERYWATDGDRMVELATLTANDGIDSDALLAIAPEKYPVIERLSEGARRGRAEAFVDGETPIVIGIVTQAPHVAILTCKGGEQAWALATWRSLRQVG